VQRHDQDRPKTRRQRYIAQGVARAGLEFGELGVDRLAVFGIFRVDPGPTSLRLSFDLVDIVGCQFHIGVCPA
jgi:hypothetical protein